MDRVLSIDGKDVKFRATARTPRLYRGIIGRDMIRDMSRLRESFKKTEDGESQLDAIDLEIFENIAYIMAKQADPDIPADPGEWLDGFNMFSIYQVLPELLKLWALNEKTTSTPKKK